MRIVFLVLSGFYALANGALMMVAPDYWYHVVPGVTASGPLNVHFVTDAGIGFLVAGLSLFAAIGERLRPLALAGAAFLVGHALYHLLGPVHETTARVALSHFIGIHLPALLSAWAAALSVRRSVATS